MDGSILEILDKFKIRNFLINRVDDYRLLRNFATCLEHQDILNNFIQGGHLDPLVEHLEFLSVKFSSDTEVIHDNEGIVQLRCGIQFLGNLVSNHQQNKLLIWQKIFPLFRILLKSPDLACRKYTLMVVYNCVLDVQHHVEALVNEEEILKRTMAITFDDNCEWGLFLLDQLLTHPEFIPNCSRAAIARPHWRALLQLVHSNMTKMSSPIIHINGILFLEKLFIADTNFILSRSHSEYPTDTLTEIVDTLDVLCCATSAEQYERRMKTETPERRPTVLLCHTIALLQAVHLVTQIQKPPTDCTVENLCNVPTYNFQKGLITLLANLCYKNTVLQNKLREVDGIPLLLDCCKFNAKIPFITQWVIFAIRNACDDNLENQEIIAQMNKLGLADISL